jgi:protoporphyrinogen IX oxidase
MTGQETAAGFNKKAGRRSFMAIAVFVAIAAAIFVVSPGDLYLWVKAIHVIAVMSWMAGMLYLPRLFINHMDAPQGSQMDETFKGMERRLMRIIMNPAMIISWVLGLWLAYVGGHLAEGWFVAKFGGVIALTAAHGWFAGSIRKFADGRNLLTQKQWRLANEVPTVLMIVIVVMVIVQPF